jgi:hypothetical protein
MPAKRAERDGEEDRWVQGVIDCFVVVTHVKKLDVVLCAAVA